MAKYKKIDNCGPVAYPDQSGRYLGDGEVVEDDAANDWAPLVALGFIVETGAAATPDRQESPAELAQAVKLVPEPAPEPAAEESSPKPKKRSKKKNKRSEGVSDGSESADDGGGTEEVDSSASRESDS